MAHCTRNPDVASGPEEPQRLANEAGRKNTRGQQFARANRFATETAGRDRRLLQDGQEIENPKESFGLKD